MTLVKDQHKTGIDTKQNRSDQKQNGIIIVDECGSQDFFGNLTVIAIFISKEDVQWFRSYDIDLSKPLDDYRILQVARDLEGRCLIHPVPITPEGYNKLDMERKDILPWAYSKAVDSLLDMVKCQHVLCNKFSSDDNILKKYFAMQSWAKHSIFVSQEKISCKFAIRSAGILATKGYLGYLIGLRKKFGINFPRGNDNRIDRVIKEFLANNTYTELGTAAKLNLKDMDQIINNDKSVMKW